MKKNIQYISSALDLHRMRYLRLIGQSPVMTNQAENCPCFNICPIDQCVLQTRAKNASLRTFNEVTYFERLDKCRSRFVSMMLAFKLALMSHSNMNAVVILLQQTNMFVYFYHVEIGQAASDGPENRSCFHRLHLR